MLDEKLNYRSNKLFNTVLEHLGDRAISNHERTADGRSGVGKVDKQTISTLRPIPVTTLSKVTGRGLPFGM